MNVLLIQAPLGRKQNPVYPIGLSYIASSITGKHTVKIIDSNISSKTEIQDLHKKFDPDVVGIGLRNIDSVQSFESYSYFQHFPPFVKWISSLSSKQVIIVGGAGFSIFPVEIMKKCKEINYGIYLEGEESFPELLENLDNPANTKGVYYRDNDKILFSGQNHLPDFAKEPAPTRMIDPKHYQNETYQLGVQTKRGCSHRCLYCNYPFLNGNIMRCRDTKQVVDEIEDLVRRFKIKKLFFADGIFNEPKNHSVEICQEIINRNIKIKWGAYFSIRGFDQSFKDLAANAGCELFDFAPDGLSQSALDSLIKDIKSSQIKEVMNLFKKSDYPRFGLNLMFNKPKIKLRELFFLAKAVIFWPIKYNSLEFVGLTNMRIYPQTPLHQFAINENIISKEDDLFKTTVYDPFPVNIISKTLRISKPFLRKIKRILVRKYSRGDQFRK